MSLIGVVITLVVVGLLLWLVYSYATNRIDPGPGPGPGGP